MKPTQYNASTCVSEGCLWTGVINTPSSPNATFKTNLNTIGTLPGTLPSITSGLQGVAYTHDLSRTFNGVPAPALLIYALAGAQQDCGILSNLADSSGNTLVSVSTPYSSSNPNNTTCIISIRAP